MGIQQALLGQALTLILHIGLDVGTISCYLWLSRCGTMPTDSTISATNKPVMEQAARCVQSAR